jgi:hypothetical protein
MALGRLTSGRGTALFGGLTRESAAGFRRTELDSTPVSATSGWRDR